MEITNVEPGIYITEENSVEVVLARMKECSDPRFRMVMASVITHLHAAIKEIEPTQDEWYAAIQFLTQTGKACTDTRQEWILLSDVLGVSMLVDTLNNRKLSGATESTVLGPFHVSGAPERELGDNICLDGKGMPVVVSGRVTDTHGNPIKGAALDVWMANEDGFYDVQQPGIQPGMNLRGIFHTDADGRYWFRSARPHYYPIPGDGPVGRLLELSRRPNMRPAHLHAIVTASGYESVCTHFFDRESPYLDSDPVFGVKESLVLDFEEYNDQERSSQLGIGNPFATVTMDFVLVSSHSGSSQTGVLK